MEPPLKSMAGLNHQKIIAKIEPSIKMPEMA
jgi:hypothetical protein